jgi:hypothetical protein
MHDGGRVVTIGSKTAVRTGSQGSSVYAMTKAAVANGQGHRPPRAATDYGKQRETQ